MSIQRRRFLKVAAAAGGAALVGGLERASAEQQFLTAAPIEDFKLFYEVHGDGPAVVFAHGSGGTHLSWWQQVPVLSKRYRCVTIDHRGFGYSRDVAKAPGRRNFASDLEALLDRLKVDRVSLVGQSMGGATALGFASKHPGRVSALILSDTTGGYTNSEIDGLRKTLPSTRTAFAPGFAEREPARAFLYREISALTLDDSPSPAAGATPAASIQPTDIRPIVAKRVPTLFIVGEQDRLLPPPIVEAMHRQMPGSQLVKVPGAGHSVYWENPGEYNRLVGEFLDKHARS